MDQETKDYLDRKLCVVVKKEDIEKLRQETKATVRQFREENRTQLLEGIQGIKSDLERWLREERETLISIQAEVKEKRPLLDQWSQDLASSLQQLKTEIHLMLDQSKQEMERHVGRILEEEASQRALSREQWKGEVQRMDRAGEGFREEMKRMGNETSSLHERIKEEFTEIKEELGSMMRFSFADLEKKIIALEARIKALEKMVFH
jgi:hypothetical protein